MDNILTKYKELSPENEEAPSSWWKQIPPLAIVSNGETPFFALRESSLFVPEVPK